MSDHDFKAASKDGFGEDWPISYADLAPYYEQVEEFLGVYGSQDNVPSLPDGKYPNKPKLTALEQDFKMKVEAKWPDRAVISPGGMQLLTSSVCLCRSWPRRKQAGSRSRTDAIVKTITVDPVTGKATGAEFVDRLTKKTGTVSANVVVLCIHVIESIRLLSQLGLAEVSKWSGQLNGPGSAVTSWTSARARFYGSVPGAMGWELDDSAPPDPFYGPSGGVCIPRFHNLNNDTNGKFGERLWIPGSHWTNLCPG